MIRRTARFVFPGAVLLALVIVPTPIVGEYTTSHVAGNGCGFVEARGRVFLTSGAAPRRTCSNSPRTACR